MLASQRLYEKFDSDSDLKYYLDDENIINREGKHNSCDEDGLRHRGQICRRREARTDARQCDGAD